MPSPAKKRKVTDNGQSQSTIQSFFSRSPQKQKQEGSSSRITIRETASSAGQKPKGEDDELMARRLASEDGLDIEAARDLEQRWKAHATRKHKPSASASIVEPEVQVIDLVSDDIVRVEGELSSGSFLKARE